MGEGLKGTLEGLRLEALLQALALSEESGVLRVVSGEKEGCIRLRKGRVVEAVSPGRKGKEAFFDLLGWEEGQVSFIPGSVEAGEELGSVEALLVEAATHQSEKGKENALSVLLVEDSGLAARTLAEIIESSPRLHLLEILTNGEEALWAAAEYDPDVILLDLHLPGLSGSRAFKYLMIQHPAPVVLTSSALGAEGLSLLLLGATAFCMKGPDQAEHLPRLLEEAAKVRVEALRRYRFSARAPAARNTSARISGLTVILSGVGGYGEVLEFLGRKEYRPEEALLWVVEGCAGAHQALAEVLGESLPWEVTYIKATTILRGGALYISTGFPALKKGWVLEPGGDLRSLLLPEEDLPLRVMVFSGTVPVSVSDLRVERMWVRDPETAPAPALPSSFQALAERSFRELKEIQQELETGYGGIS
ncbi:MAG TPA: DUF4388 domain-containing protein [Thermosulfurimonas dismutans]|uniref:DUF4388 domain-containing protein n=1 Tax=Thermosulfurimonas dismutans TaxID=999894 RepID=A0A7C3GUT2_9BACT|nr:DUF4388 domain-containing protein [Thermosulfurimonas dismutans]